MEEIRNLRNMSIKELNAVLLAVYVVKSQNDKYNGYYSFGVAGIKGGKLGLGDRIRNHEMDKTKELKKDGSQLFRHAASRWKRFWAADLSGWSKKGLELAEWTLCSSFAQKFRLYDTSCFFTSNEKYVEEVLKGITYSLQLIESRSEFYMARRINDKRVSVNTYAISTAAYAFLAHAAAEHRERGLAACSSQLAGVGRPTPAPSRSGSPALPSHRR